VVPLFNRLPEGWPHCTWPNKYGIERKRMTAVEETIQNEPARLPEDPQRRSVKINLFRFTVSTITIVAGA